jgi:hypothetical protein
VQFLTKLAPVTDCNIQSDAGEHYVTVDVSNVTLNELIW